LRRIITMKKNKRIIRIILSLVVLLLLLGNLAACNQNNAERDLPEEEQDNTPVIVMVGSFEELQDALDKKVPAITMEPHTEIRISSSFELKSDLSITGGETSCLIVDKDATFSIAEETTLTVRFMRFEVHGTLVNQGVLDIAEDGKISFYNNNSEIGIVICDTKLGNVEIIADSITDAEFLLYLSKETPYTAITLADNGTFPVKNDITIVKDITLYANGFYLNTIDKLIVKPDVTLTVKICNFNVSGLIENEGYIIVAPFGRITFYRESPNIGNIKAVGNDPDSPFSPVLWDYGQIVITPNTPALSSFAEYLAPDSIYTAVGLYFGGNTENDMVEIVITEDFVIPKGKAIVMNICCIVVVPKGITLTVDGYIDTYHKPVVEGTLIGEDHVIVSA